MRMKVLLKTESAALSRQFYEDELAMFRLEGELWERACSLRSLSDDSFGIQLASYFNPPPDLAMPLFSLIVEDCDREFSRLFATTFASGGRLVPDEKGMVEVFEYPGGRNFIMEDPSGNRFLIAQDRRVVMEDDF